MTGVSDQTVEPHAEPLPGVTRYSEIQAWLVERIAAELEISPSEIDTTADLTSYGLGSMQAVSLSGDVEEWLDVSVPATLAYEYPTIDAIAAHLESLGTATKINISAADHLQTHRRASLGQRRLWFLQKLDDKDVSYNEAISIELEGDLHLALVRNALDDVVSEQESLRVSFAEADGEVYLVAGDRVGTGLSHVDLSNVPEAQASQLACDLSERLATLPFDLGRAPLARFAVISFGGNRYSIVIATHHLICDAFSLDVFGRRLSESYNARLRTGSRVPPRESLPVYADYADFQRQQLTSGELEPQAAYWTRRLQPAPPPTQLPAKACRSEQGISSCGSLERFELSEATRGAVMDAGMRHGATVFMTLLAAFKIVLFRYTGQTDLVVGTTVAGRQRPETRDLIGFFVNTIPIRTSLSNDPTFADVLRRIRTACLDAFANQDYPFDQISRLMPKLDGSASVPNVALTFLNAPAPISFEGADELERSIVHTNTSKFDLSLLIQEHGAGYRCAVEYRSDLFEPETITRLTKHFESVLNFVTNDDGVRLSGCDVLLREEQDFLGRHWHGPSQQPPLGCLHDFFAAQARRTPDAVAVESDSHQITYSELDSVSTSLALELSDAGVGPETYVPVCLDRSAEMVIGMLGILKAGAAYVPLDPAYPQARIQQVLRSTNASVVLTSSQFPFNDASLRAFDLDSWRPQRTKPSFRIAVDTENAAYVITTSGSTGDPKGVVVSHRAAVNHMHWMQSEYPLAAGDSVLQKTPFGFDASIWEFFAPLFAGARLVMARPHGHQDPHYLWDTVRSRQITTLQLVPSQLRMLLDADSESQWHGLRRLFCGGEALPTALVKRFQHRCDAEVINLYGPTEATIDASHHRCSRALDDRPTVSLGRPVDNTLLVVTNEHQSPVPLGAVGELLIGGQSLSRGYLGQPGLTAEKFVPDSRSGASGERLYRSGDLVSPQSSGRLEYHGRSDGQAKIRGHRIELSEIELSLAEHPAIESASVDVRQRGQSESLIGFVVPINQAPNAADLRSFLLERLPEHMVPAVFVELDSLPLNSNGKLDRNALPQLDEGRRLDAGAVYREAQSSTERRLLEIWEDVLGIEGIGVDDGFFDLGGDSILCLQVVSKANQAGLSISLNELMQHRTIRALARHTKESAPTRATQGPVVGEGVLTPIQEWFFAQRFEQADHWNQALLLTFQSPIEVDHLSRAVSQVLMQHDVLRSRFRAADGAGSGGYKQIQSASMQGWSLEQVDLTGADPEQVDALISETAVKAQASLDLDQGTVFRGIAFDCGSNESKLLLVAHHLVVDGVSWRVLLEDLHTCYRSLGEHSEPMLPAKSTAYQHWASRLAEYANTDAVREAAHYWLDEVVEDVGLPTDRNTGPNDEVSTATISVSLNETTTEALLREAPSAYNTDVNDVLLAAFVHTMCSWLKTEAVHVNLEGHGRESIFEDVDLSRTVGWFTTLFPVNLRCLPSSSLGDQIKSIKQQLGKIPGRGLPYGLLRYVRSVEDCDLRTRFEQLPVPQISFNYLGQVDHVLAPDASFSLSKFAMGSERAPVAKRPHLLDVTCIVRSAQLEFVWAYSANRHSTATIERLATRCVETLEQLVDHCASTEELAYAEEDFAVFDWDDEELADIITEVNQSAKE